MGKLKRKLRNLVVKIYVSVTNSSLKQGENIAQGGEGHCPEATSLLLRRAAREGAVLLKNDGVLPLEGKTCFFGRVQTDGFYTGYGSGGDVVKPYRVSFLDGIKQSGIEYHRGLAARYENFSKRNPVNHGYWGNWPWSFPEMPISVREIQGYAKEAKNAVVFLGRAAGEDRDNELKKGSFYLTDGEVALLDGVTSCFSRVALVLDIGNVIDLSFLERYGEKIGSVLLLWQGGMEAGNACADLLSGKVSPSGKLPFTVAREYRDYPSCGHFGGIKYNEYYEDIYVGYRYFETFAPEKVLFPFGFGLSYTSFERSFVWGKGGVTATIKNVGKARGKDVVQVYVRKPCRGLGNPERELVCFAKTKELAAGEKQTIFLPIPEESFYSFDDGGKATGYAHSEVMLAGEYTVYAGADVRSATPVYTFAEEKTKCIAKHKAWAAPKESFPILAAKIENGKRVPEERKAYKGDLDLKREMLDMLPKEYPAHEGSIRFSDVKEGKATLKEFVATLSLEELEAISRGDYVMDSPLGASGNAGTFGGVLPSLREKGVPVATCTDGPSGIRLRASSSLIPIGTLLASTFDEELVSSVYALLGREMKERGSDVLLAPAMNLCRDPLCGRNFEYFSEDPYLTGKIAAAAVRGVQSEGVSACPKHFACNNQEINRNHNDSRLSERALRELYLKGFEICVKEGKPQNLMTSYNKVNGVWAHYQFALVQGILRGEWGYEGNVVTDWWMRSDKCPEFPKLRVNAYRVRAGVNVLMPGGGFTGRRKPDGTLLESLGKEDGITLGELQQNAETILSFLLNSSAYIRYNQKGDKQ